ncbi:hypothetical protein GPECTOR_17g845 [Gonium pectorale]|uniref:Uncharacterized protein n=1 Tax=Gonium pectorale TaxID=33097 RepID=A0A150GK80_GONPE|nr:hypothetical protein GPECTOR_17g845 [Gonium pectorale]|eukprot:KXZ50208.1 hypothetical protein GPECTOR_17g845 [Gonium pectorale]
MKTQEDYRAQVMARLLPEQPRQQKAEEVLALARENTKQRIAFFKESRLAESRHRLQHTSAARVQYGAEEMCPMDDDDYMVYEEEQSAGGKPLQPSTPGLASDGLAFGPSACAGVGATARSAYVTAAPADPGAEDWVYRAAGIAADPAANGKGRLRRASLLHMVYNNAGVSAVLAVASGSVPAGQTSSDDEIGNEFSSESYSGLGAASGRSRLNGAAATAKPRAPSVPLGQALTRLQSRRCSFLSAQQAQFGGDGDAAAGGGGRMTVSGCERTEGGDGDKSGGAEPAGAGASTGGAAAFGTISFKGLSTPPVREIEPLPALALASRSSRRSLDERALGSYLRTTAATASLSASQSEAGVSSLPVETLPRGPSRQAPPSRYQSRASVAPTDCGGQHAPAGERPKPCRLSVELPPCPGSPMTSPRSTQDGYPHQQPNGQGHRHGSAPKLPSPDDLRNQQHGRKEPGLMARLFRELRELRKRSEGESDQ